MFNYFTPSSNFSRITSWVVLVFPMVINRESIILFILANFISLAIGASNSTYCKRSCGEELVNYPFGFSDGCEIRLNCIHNIGIKIAKFHVRNVTSDAIMVNIPAQCNRKVEEIKILFGPNYAVSGQNALLLQKCSSAQNNCTIPTVMLENRFDLRRCSSASGDGDGNVSCYPVAKKGVGVLTYENINSTDCKLLFSSIAVNSGIDNSDVSIEFQTIQLDWWLPGDCRCSANARCRQVAVANCSSGYRCSCADGFIGDGYAQGSGCHAAAGDNSQRTMILVLIGGIIAGGSAVGLLVLTCYFICRRCVSFTSRKCANRFLYEASSNPSVVHYPYKEIKRATCSFSEQKRLGTGAYGTVYEGRLNNDECVAIKKIKNQGSDSIEQVMNEIKLISCVSHPNLVRLLGCCIENGEQILVYEFMANGTLCQHLQREKGKVLPWTVRLTIATETAQAIAHLHSTVNPPIYHRDIKSSNILLDANYKSKVADFGLSRVGMADSSHISTGPQGTPGYVDPQYHQNYHLSDKSDVYSFGVLLMEIITAMKVVDFSRPNTEINLASLAVDRIGKGRLDEIVDPCIDPHRDAWTLNSIHKVAELGFRCLAYHRDMRPSMPEVAEELESVRLSAWATSDDTGSPAASCCSSSERSFATLKKVIVFPKEIHRLPSLEECKDGSPVSVQDAWLSANSSPSAHSLLEFVIQ
ncbi:hypothetical protein V2J09_016517 [Rumex salicifolius]